MNFSFKIDGISKFSFRNEIPQKVKENKAVFANSVCAIFAETVKAVSISLDDYFYEIQ